MSIARPLAAATVALATLAAVPRTSARAQTPFTIDFANAGPTGSGDLLATTFGSTVALALTSSTRRSLGNALPSVCAGNPSSAVLYYGAPTYPTSFSGLSGIAQGCGGEVAQFVLNPLGHQSLFLGTLLLGSNGNPDSPFTVNVYDGSFNLLFSQTGRVGFMAPVTVSPGLTTTGSLILQVAAGSQGGVGRINGTIGSAVASVPEPGTFALLVPGALLVGALWGVRPRRDTLPH